MLLGAFVIACVQYADPSYGSTTVFGIGGVFVLGMGALLLGFIAMMLWNVAAPAFFRGETLSKKVDSDLVLVALDHEDRTLRLPDSGLPEIIIAPDLSNLPPGMTAMDMETGRSIDDTGELRALNAERLAALRAEEEAHKDAEARTPRAQTRAAPAPRSTHTAPLPFRDRPPTPVGHCGSTVENSTSPQRKGPQR